MPHGNQMGVLLAFPEPPPPPAPSLELIAIQARDYLADLLPLFDQPDVRRGLFRLVSLLNGRQSTGAALRVLALHLARALADGTDLHTWLRGRLIEAQKQVLVARKTGALPPIPEEYIQYHTESEAHHGRQ